MTPRFDQPTFTRPAPAVVTESRVTLPEGRALPALTEPAGHPQVDHLTLPGGAAGDPLVLVEHPRIRILSQYFHAGWQHARLPAWLRREVALRLYAVADGLPDRWGLAVFDAWRSLLLQRELFDAAYADPELPPGFLAEPSPDPRTPPPHLTGGTVDVTLTLDGTPLALGTGFDDFTGRAALAACEHEDGADRAGRRMLYWAMRDQGFVVLAGEWWHFELGTRRWAAITGAAPRYGAAEP